MSILKHLLRIDASSIKYYAEESFDIEENSSNKEKLRHSFFFGIVTMKNRVGIRIGSAGIIKSIKDQLIVIMITDYIGHRPVVTEI